MVPRVHSFLQATEKWHKDGFLFYEVFHPEQNRSFPFYDSEWLLIEYLKEPHTLEEVIQFAEKTLGYQPTKAELSGFFDSLLHQNIATLPSNEKQSSGKPSENHQLAESQSAEKQTQDKALENKIEGKPVENKQIESQPENKQVENKQVENKQINITPLEQSPIVNHFSQINSLEAKPPEAKLLEMKSSEASSGNIQEPKSLETSTTKTNTAEANQKEANSITKGEETKSAETNRANSKPKIVPLENASTQVVKTQSLPQNVTTHTTLLPKTPIAPVWLYFLMFLLLGGMGTLLFFIFTQGI